MIRATLAVQVQLNYDILETILQHLYSSCRPTFRGMMRTCHFLYRIGIHLMLDKQVFLNEDMLESFNVFLESTLAVADRPRHLKTLALSLNHLDVRTDEPLITRILECATSLRTIRFQDCYDLGKLPHAMCAITKLTALKTLHIVEDHAKYITPAVIDMLQNMESHVEVIAAKLGEETRNSVGELFGRFSPSLETLAVASRDLHVGDDATFPAVHTLWIHNDWPPDELAHHLVRAFPNLCSLTLTVAQRVGGGYVGTASDGGRGRNVAQQRGSSLGWARLEHVQMTLSDLWDLAIPCPIRKLSIDDYPVDEENADALGVILAESRPEYLDVAVDVHSIEDFKRALQNASDSLTHLRLTLVVPREEKIDAVALTDKLPTLLDGLKNLKQVVLSIRISFEAWEVMFAPRTAIEQLNMEHPVITHLLSLNATHLAGRIFAQQATLTELQLEFVKMRTHNFRKTHVEGAAAPALVEGGLPIVWDVAKQTDNDPLDILA